MHFQRPARRRRHVGYPAVVAHDDPLPRLDFGVHEVAQQVAAGALVIRFGVLQFGFQLRRDERVAVNLAVWMGERDADFLTVVLERENLFNTVDMRDLGGAEGPRLDNRAQATHRQIGGQTMLVGVEAYDLAPAAGHFLLPQRVAVDIRHRVRHAGHAHHRGETVFEDDNVVIGIRHFAVLIRVTRLARGERVALRSGPRTGGDRPVHARSGHGDPVAGQRVAAHLRCSVRHLVAVGVQMRREAVGEMAGVMQFAGLLAADVLRVVIEIEEVASVGEGGRCDADVGARICAGLIVLPCRRLLGRLG